MLELISYKVMVMVLVLSILNVIRHGWLFFIDFNQEKKIQMPTSTLLLLGLSISFIVTIIFTGLK
jgi:hypothetical protein